MKKMISFLLVIICMYKIITDILYYTCVTKLNLYDIVQNYY